MTFDLSALIERLTSDLTADLPPEILGKLLIYLAAVELWIESDYLVQDRSVTGLVASRLALQALGLSDSSIERARTQLVTGREADSLNRRQ